MVHQGAIIEKVCRRSGISIAELARRLKVNRRTIYNWYERPTLSIDIISGIGAAIGYDFSKDFPDFNLTSPTAPVSGTPTTPGDMEQLVFWKKKYLDLLEKYNRLLEKSILLDDVA